MQRRKDSLVPIGDALADLGGPVQAIREASPQALHHFTQADQVNQLVGASEAEADLGFMARMLVLCSLPRTNPGNRLQYKRVNGPYSLIMTAGGKCARRSVQSESGSGVSPWPCHTVANAGFGVKDARLRQRRKFGPD